jgi:membrane protein
MILIDYIKIIGVVLSLLLILFQRRQYLSAWIKIGRFNIYYADWMLGYFLSTLVCSLTFYPDSSTYAAWVFYATIIVGISTYGMMFLGDYPNKLVITLNILYVAEVIAITMGDLFWDWQWEIIFTGLVGALTITAATGLLRTTATKNERYERQTDYR